MQNKNYREFCMGLVATHNPGLKLRSTVIPETHNSGSYTIDSMASSFARCQDYSITKQLKSGVRFFDIRCGSNSSKDSDYWIYHGVIGGGSILNIIKDIVSFLKKNGTEFIIVELINEHDRPLKKGQMKHLLGRVSNITQGLRVSSSDKDWREFMAPSATIKRVSGSKRCLLFLLHKGFYKAGFASESYLEQQGYWRKDSYINNKWHDEQDRDKLFNKNKHFCISKKSDSSKYLVSQMTLTPSFG